MTRFYPSVIDKEHNSEVKFFNQLKYDEKNNNWLVLHSLGLSDPAGEIDFVILIPGEGIVCVEIKGGRVFCENGDWYGVNGNDEIHKKSKSPFMQARKNMFNLKDACFKYFGSSHILSKMTWHYMVCFTDIESPPVTPEFKRSQVIDINQMTSILTKTILGSIRAEREQLGKLAAHFAPTQDDMKSMLKFIRPNFDRVPLKAASIAYSEKQIASLTQEQYDSLDLLEWNERCIIEGAAGTGKTVLAIEYARRMASSGKNVLFLCYNSLLGLWLKQQLNDYANLTVGNFHKVFSDLIMESGLGEQYLHQEKKVDNFFSEGFCRFVMDAVLEKNTQYDLIIVDEIQDLSLKNYLDVFDLCLKNGLSGSNWAFFGDFNRQSIYAEDWFDPKQQLKMYLNNSGYTYQRLKINCRNSQEIARATAYLSGFDEVPTKAALKSNLPVEYVTWQNQQEQIQKLTEILTSIKNNNILPNQIMILSPKTFENSSIRNVAEKLRISPLNKADFNKSHLNTGFSTIYSYKGMESPVVILIDLEPSEHKKYDSLLYIGMSRAKSLLYLLMAEETYSILQPRMLKKMMEDHYRD